jgi:hypothetical protein
MEFCQAGILNKAWRFVGISTVSVGYATLSFASLGLPSVFSNGRQKGELDKSQFFPLDLLDMNNIHKY